MRRLMFLALLLVLAAFAAPAYAGVPYVDTGFTGRTTGEADLVVARELVDDNTYQQAIYFRMAPIEDDVNYEIGGTITFPPGIEIVDVFYNSTTLANSHADWAIPGGDYSGQGFGGQDRMNWDSNTVNFNAHFSYPVDSFRVVIDYGDSFPESASFDIQLRTGQGTFQIYSTGIQVGNTDGVVPGSGDFGEVASLTVPLIEGLPPAISGCIELYGDPLSEIEVTLKQQGSPSLSTMTDSNGCYKFKDAVVGEKIKLEFDNPN